MKEEEKSPGIVQEQCQVVAGWQEASKHMYAETLLLVQQWF